MTAYTTWEREQRAGGNVPELLSGEPGKSYARYDLCHERGLYVGNLYTACVDDWGEKNELITTYLRGILYSIEALV